MCSMMLMALTCSWSLTDVELHGAQSRIRRRRPRRSRVPTRRCDRSAAIRRRSSVRALGATASRQRVGARGGAQRRLRVDAGDAGQVDRGEQQVADGGLVGVDVSGRERRRQRHGGGRRPRRAAPSASGAGLLLHLEGVEQGGQWRRGCRRTRSSRPFSAFLICSQLAHHVVGVVDLDVAEHVRVAAYELVVHASGHVGQREPARLGGERGVEEHLEEQVAELLLEVLVARRRLARRGRRWPRAPRRSPRAGGGAATRASARGPTGTRARSVATSSTKRASSPRDRGGQVGDVERGEVVGVDARSSSAQATLDPLVGQAEPLQDHDRGVGAEARSGRRRGRA